MALNRWIAGTFLILVIFPIISQSATIPSTLDLQRAVSQIYGEGAGFALPEQTASDAEVQAQYELEYQPAIKVINVDTQWHSMYGDYIDAKGAAYKDGDKVYFRFKLQGIKGGGVLLIFLTNERHSVPLKCGYPFKDDNNEPFNLKLACEIKPEYGLSGKYRVVVSILKYPVSLIQRFWGFEDESYYISINEGLPAVSPPQRPKVSWDWGKSFELEVVRDVVQTAPGKPREVKLVQETQKQEFSEALPGQTYEFEMKKSIPSLVNEEVQMRSFSLRIKDEEKQTICEVDAKGRPTSVECIPAEKDTGLKVEILEVKPDSIVAKIDSVKRPPEVPAEKPVAKVEAKPDETCEYDASDLWQFSSMKTRGKLIISSGRKDAQILVKPINDVGACLKISQPKLLEEGFWGKVGLFFGGRHEYEAEVSYDPICQFAGRQGGIEIEDVGECGKTTVPVDVEGTARVILITTAKLQTDARFERALRGYIETLAGKEKLTAKFIIADGKYREKWGIGTGEIRSASRAAAVVDKLLHSTLARYAIILGGVDVFPMPSVDIIGGKAGDSGSGGINVPTDTAYLQTARTPLGEKTPEPAISRMPTPKGDLSSEFVSIWLENAVKARERQNEEKDTLIIGDACGSNSASNCFIRADAFSKIFSANLGGLEKACASNSDCVVSPDYCQRNEKDGKACKNQGELEGRLERSDVISFITHGGGGTNFHAESGSGFYTILAAADAEGLKFESPPVIFADGCNAGSIDSAGPGADWKNWQGTAATENKMVLFPLVRAGAAAYIGSTSLVFGSGGSVSHISEFADAMSKKGVRIGDSFSAALKNLKKSSSPAAYNKFGFQLYGDPTLSIYGPVAQAEPLPPVKRTPIYPTAYA